MSLIVPINKNEIEEIQHPINAFPEHVQNIISHYSDAKGYPSEYFIQAFIAACSCAMGRSITIQSGNYNTIASVWSIILGKRGFVKSEPLADAFKPIKKRQFDIYSRHQNEKDELEQYKLDHPKAKVKDIPEPKKIIISDSTPEKLVMILAANPKGCALVNDEISGFVKRFDRYAGGADEEMFLSLFNGDTILRDRMNGHGNAYAKHSFLTIIGTTQPDVLREVFSNKASNGFFDRWLITRPDDLKKQYPNEFGINPLEEEKYDFLINRLLSLEFTEHAQKMGYTADSYQIINTYQKQIIDIENATENENLRGVLAKMEIYLHKFALILQTIEYSLTGDEFDLAKVSVKSANGAVILTKYFIDQAKRVRIASPAESLKDQWVSIYKALPEHGIKFDRKQFIKTCDVYGIKERAADNFLKEHGLRSENSLLFKIAHGLYTKNLF